MAENQGFAESGEDITKSSKKQHDENIEKDDNKDDDNAHGNEQLSIATSLSTSYDSEDQYLKQTSRKMILTHYIILVHGYWGNAKEMAYIEQSLEERITHEKKKMQQHKHIDEAISFPRIKIHSSSCNEGKTGDGIINGGTRLANEIHQFIRNDMINLTTNEDKDGGLITSTENDIEVDVTLSILGNSMGGLYARYALSSIPSNIMFDISSSVQCVIHIHSNIFITTVTPHLGLASNCSFKTSQLFEHVSARMMGKSVQDLFLLDHKIKLRKDDQEKAGDKENDHSIDAGDNDDEDGESILFEMATNYKRFLKPLIKFQKRISYINSFHTDFQVHTTTAGFFSNKSIYPHTFPVAKDFSKNKDHHPYILATSTTEQNKYMVQSKVPSYKQVNGAPHKRKHEINVQNLIMSNKLDALGWSKVFVDSREMNPIKTFRKVWHSDTSRNVWDKFLLESQKSQSTLESNDSKKELPIQCLSSTLLLKGQLPSMQNSSVDDEGLEEDDDPVVDENIVRTVLKKESVKGRYNRSVTVASKDLFHYMTRNERLQIPMGHSIIIANSKSPFCEKMNSNGRPIVDYLAENFVRDVVQFNSVK